MRSEGPSGSPSRIPPPTCPGLAECRHARLRSECADDPLRPFHQRRACPGPGAMDVRRPYDGKAYAALPCADAAIVDQAVEAARTAFAGSARWVAATRWITKTAIEECARADSERRHRGQAARGSSVANDHPGLRARGRAPDGECRLYGPG